MRSVLVVLVALMSLVDGRGVRGQAQSVQNPQRPTSMFAVYDENRERGIPNYITEDFLVMGYVKTLGVALEQMEATLAADLRALVRGLDAAVHAAPASSAKTANEDFLAVLALLFDGEHESTSHSLSDRARAELTLIQEASGIAPSPLLRQRIDYSQFRVRGEYAAKPERGRYFLATKFAGLALFPLRASAATGVSAADADLLTAQAAMLSRLAWADQTLRARVESIDRRLSWMFGAADDLTVADYAAVLGRHSLTEQSDGLRATLLTWAVDAKRRPRIIGGVVDGSQLEPNTSAADVLVGWRLLPQRATPDGAALQELVFDRVGAYKGRGRPASATIAGGRVVKGFPLGNELMALLGSSIASSRLVAGDERNYEGYAAGATRARRMLDARSDTLAAAHLALIKTQLATSPAPPSRRLNSALAFWTRLRHLTLAYTKQSYSVAGKGISRDNPRRAAYIDPNPALYSSLAALTARVAEHVGADVPELKAFREIAERAAAIATRIRAGAPLPAADVDYLNDLDLTLAELFEEEDIPVVADVHTDPNSGDVLQEGIAFPAIATKAVGTVQTRGALATHVEFRRSMTERLNDDEWMALLRQGFAPARDAERRIGAGGAR